MPRNSISTATMSPRRMRIEQALDLLPDLEDLLPLRAELAGASRDDAERAWTDAEAYATLDTRLLDADALEAALPELVERERQRLESVYGNVARALRASADGDDAEAARALVAAGEVEEAAGRWSAAEALFRRAAELGRRPRDRSAEALALRRLARVARSRGALQEALRLYRRAYDVADAMRDPDGLVVACQGLGNVQGDQGRWAEAEQWYRRGLEHAGSESVTRAHWQLQSNLSVVARRSGRLEEAEQWLRRAAASVAELGDRTGEVYVHNAEGLLRLAGGDAGGAEASYRAALDAAGTAAERGTVLINLAEPLLRLGRPAEAEAALRELERLALAHRLVGFLPHAYRGLGAVALARSDERGFLFYEQALTLCAQEALPDMERAQVQAEYGAFELEMGRTEGGLARLQEAWRLFRALGMAPEKDAAAARLRAAGAEPMPVEPERDAREESKGELE